MTTVLPPAYRGEQRVTGPRVLRSEWTKRSLPATMWSLLTAVVLIIGFGVAYSMVRVTRPPAYRAAFDAVGVSLAGVQLAQLAIGTLGVLLITGEYATGSIRASLAAVPGRLHLLWGKAVAFALTTIALSVPAVFVAFAAGHGQASLFAQRDPKWTVEAWTGFGVFCLYTAIVLGLAAWQLRRRDA